jgi:hypothetical protein
MKRLTVLAFLLSFGVAWAQQTPKQPKGSEFSQETVPVPTSLCPSCAEQNPVSTAKSEQTTTTAQVQIESLELAPVSEQPHPERYAVAFLPLDKENVGVAFLVTPAGKAGTLPIRRLAEAAKAGYRPFTVADLLATANALADEEKNLQRKVKELAEDYDALAARYNRLAAVNSANSVQSQPAFDERQAMRAMVFQSLLQRAQPYQLPMPTQPNSGVNCITTHIGSTAYTNCH